MTVNPDDIWRKIKILEGRDKKLIDELRAALINNIELSKLFVIFKYVKQLIKENKSIRIFDYGCGGGQLLTYLRVLGYTNLTGIDVKSQEEIDKLNKLHSNMGFDTCVFYTYNGTSLPFDDSSFDVIISQQVIEHVHSIEKYFLECERVLSPTGKILLDFPHRLVPFDTHTRMWFVHYFPISVRNYFYNKYRNNRASDYRKTLNLKSMFFYNKLLNNSFSTIVNMTSDRIKDFTYRGHYEGNTKLRIFIDKLVNLPIIGVYLRKVMSTLANSTLIVSK